METVKWKGAEMALRKCDECGKEIYEHAFKCTNCGAVNKKTIKYIKLVLFLMIAGYLILYLAYNLYVKYY